MAATGVAEGLGKRKEQFYAPGWADRIIDWVGRLPLPGWLFYLLVWFGAFLLETVVNWYSGVYPPGTIYSYHMFVSAIVVYGLAAIHYLDKVAEDELKSFRPALIGDDDDFAMLRYRFTTMPARASVLAGAFGIVFVLIFSSIVIDSRILGLVKLFDSAPSAVLNGLLLAIGWPTMGVFVYHTVRQLNLIHHVYATATHVNLYRRWPLYAFSGLSARTAISLALIPYVGIITRPGVTENIGVLLLAGLLTVAGLLIFVWPLLGIHRIMEAEKKRLLDENGRKLEAAIAETHKRWDAQDLAGMDDLKNTLDNLVTEQTVISKISTWPWQSGTVGVLATALLLPILLWIVQRILERLLAF
jgi:hypothetical protein